MASSEGGMNIEEVAEHTPELIHKLYVDPITGITDEQADDLARKMGMPEASVGGARTVLQGLYKAFVETDADLAEINPLITTGEGKVVALDAKMNFDSNALFLSPEIAEMRDLTKKTRRKSKPQIRPVHISPDGNIGCLVNGAGLAMATMDTIKLYGGEPANFLDVGGGASTEKVTEAFKIMLKNPNLKAILINIFGGIMKCDVIAEGGFGGQAGAFESAVGRAHERQRMKSWARKFWPSPVCRLFLRTRWRRRPSRWLLQPMQLIPMVNSLVWRGAGVAGVVAGVGDKVGHAAEEVVGVLKPQPPAWLIWLKKRRKLWGYCRKLGFSRQIRGQQRGGYRR